MTQSIAKIKNYKAAPRKMRLIADFVRGKNVNKALSELKFLNKRHAKGVMGLLQSAVANADGDTKDMRITDIQVQEGQKMKRYRAGSHGRALPMKKRMSHISVTLDDVKKVKKEAEEAEVTDNKK